MDFPKLLFLLNVIQSMYETTTSIDIDNVNFVNATTDISIESTSATETPVLELLSNTERSAESTSTISTTVRSTSTTNGPTGSKYTFPPSWYLQLRTTSTAEISTESTSTINRTVRSTTTDRTVRSTLTTDRTVRSTLTTDIYAEPEFIAYKETAPYSFDEAVERCRKEKAGTLTYQILYPHHSISSYELEYIYSEVGRTAFEEGAKIWTDLHVLHNDSTVRSMVTGDRYEWPRSFDDETLKVFGNKDRTCVVLIWNKDSKHMLQTDDCGSLNRVICRAHFDLTTTSPATSSPDVPCPVCDCATKTDEGRLTQDEVENVVREIRKNLTVSKANLSSSIRKRISASDPRMSSQIIGMTLGVSVLSFAVGVIIITDFISLLKFVLSKCCSRK